MAKQSRLTGLPPEAKGLFLLNPEHKLVPEMGRILSLIKEYDMILASGHISPPEVFALVEAALAMGISKLVITHPLSRSSMDEGLSLEEQQRLGQMGAFIEHDYIGFLPNERRDDPEEMVEAIRAVGAEHCIITTDLGQYMNPPAAEGMRMFIALLLKNGITEHEIELMAKVNPSKLLGLN
jgi:predicted metal-dependent phosphotriesterase family hydrolase